MPWKDFASESSSVEHMQPRTAMLDEGDICELHLDPIFLFTITGFGGFLFITLNICQPRLGLSTSAISTRRACAIPFLVRSNTVNDDQCHLRAYINIHSKERCYNSEYTIEWYSLSVRSLDELSIPRPRCTCLILFKLEPVKPCTSLSSLTTLFNNFHSAREWPNSSRPSSLRFANTYAGDWLSRGSLEVQRRLWCCSMMSARMYKTQPFVNPLPYRWL